MGPLGSIASDVTNMVGQSALTVIHSTATYLAIETVSRVAECLYQKYSGVLVRPKEGFARFLFKIVRPFSGLENNHYKVRTSVIVVSTIGATILDAATHGRAPASPSYVQSFILTLIK